MTKLDPNPTTTARDWGAVMVATRLEKMVEDDFVEHWTHLIARGLRPGDAFALVKGKVAHQAANEAARRLLLSECDSILYIDSDASFGWDLLEQMRELPAGQEYDGLQAFYTRRGWPPEAIWFTESALGDIQQMMVWSNDLTTEVALVGLHFTLIRREVFEVMLADRPADISEEDFDWFFYPRSIKSSEDGAFSTEARKLQFRLAATSEIKTGHIGRITTGWATYQEYLDVSGIRGKWDKYHNQLNLVAEFRGESVESVSAKAARGSDNVQAGVIKHNPQTPEQWRQFYGESDSGYFYELLAWNFSPFYQAVVAPLADHAMAADALVVGGGLGGEVDALLAAGADCVEIFELPGALRAFLEFKYKKDTDRVGIIQSPTLLEFIKPVPLSYDFIVAVDTLEHIHPTEFIDTMDAILAMLAADGVMYFRNNWGQQEVYPMHFDNSELYNAWLADNGLEIYRTVDRVQGEFVRRIEQ